MQRLILAAFLAALFVVSGVAQPRVETCEDGTVLTISPFNPEPCKNRSEKLAKPEYPDDFLLAYGPPPEPTQDSLADRVARVQYEQQFKQFRGLIAEPAGYAEVADFYAQAGLGQPVFIHTVYGDYVRWPQPDFGIPWQASIFSAVRGAGVIVPTWQSRMVVKGMCLFALHGSVPPWVRSKNADNCAAAAVFDVLAMVPSVREIGGDGKALIVTGDGAATFSDITGTFDSFYYDEINVDYGF